MAFSLSIYPWVYTQKYNNGWKGEFIEQKHLSVEEEEKLSAGEKETLLIERNQINGMPLVNYTTQYGLGCFEGVKAFPQKDGSMKIFRPDENALRMKRSMEGLLMPAPDADDLCRKIIETVKYNNETGFTVNYDPAWEEKKYLNASAIYIRPFSYAEAGIGINLSTNPWIIIVTTPVSAYFEPGMSHDAITTDMVRATPKGTGWIKCNANYVIPTLAKKNAMKQGYMEAVFLDAKEQKYIEEGSSCNFFCLMKSGELVTPSLGDTVLPGITRKSIITLAKDRGLKVEERKLSVEEVFENGEECFVTGTAAGITHLGSLTHNDNKKEFLDGNIGPVAESILSELKGIQYGAEEDRYGWMFEV